MRKARRNIITYNTPLFFTFILKTPFKSTYPKPDFARDVKLVIVNDKSSPESNISLNEFVSETYRYIPLCSVPDKKS